MKEQLKQKIESWSKDKLTEDTHGAEIPVFEDKSSFIQEYADDGIYIYSNKYAKFYGNDGSVVSLSDHFTDNDPIIYNELYEISISSPYKFYQLMEHNIIQVAGKDYMYLRFSYPSNKPAIPFWAFESVDTEYMLYYIKSIEFIINTLDSLNLPYPDDAINIMKFLKDPDSDNVYCCPIFGPNNWKFSQTDKNEFLKEQMRRIVHHKQVMTVDTGEEKPLYIDWDVIKEKTKLHWWGHKNNPPL